MRTQKGSGKRIFPVAELFKPRGLKEERSDDWFKRGVAERSPLGSTIKNRLNVYRDGFYKYLREVHCFFFIAVVYCFWYFYDEHSFFHLGLSCISLYLIWENYFS